MKNILTFAAAMCALFGGACIVASANAHDDPNLAMNNPDRQAWELFMQVNITAPGGNNALFETWGRDADLFKANPQWPNSPAPILGAPRALNLAAAHKFQLEVVPGDDEGQAEETRRNKSAFDFVVQNNLYKVSGLKAAFASGKPISFPADSLEVKANWVEFPTALKKFNGFSGSLDDARRLYHINSVGGKTYALVSFHIISKLVPNWTWATFEHSDNPGRCDITGCIDNFGSMNAFEKPKSLTESVFTGSPATYGPCEKTPELLAMFAAAQIDKAFKNYCLKGTQSDFTDSSGLAIRLGNSVTEKGFVAQASCMSCHGRAGFDQTGYPASFAGFDIVSPNAEPGADGTLGHAPLGSIDANWYWLANGPPYSPATVGGDAVRIQLPADFVWSIPFCAYDDTISPAKSRCQKK